MDATRISKLSRFLLAGLGLAGCLLAETKGNGYNIPLWEKGKVPLAAGDGPLDNPFLTVFAPPEGMRNGASIVVVPGGGNIMLMYGSEGIDIAEYYNDWGVTAFVLTYRLSPKYNDQARIADGKRAIQMVRAHAAGMKLDPTKVGYIGFSAGSNIGRPIVGTSGPGDPAAADPVDHFSSRPDYLVLVYGPGRAAQGEVLKNFPPTFLMAAEDDRGPAVGNAQFFIELVNARVPAEIHTYHNGHHGFGTGFSTGSYGDWMPRLQNFLKDFNLLPGGKK